MNRDDRLVRKIVIGLAIVEVLVIAFGVAAQLHLFGR